MSNTDAEKAAEEWARSESYGWNYEDPTLEDMAWQASRGFLAGAAWAAPKWISVKERLPEEDEQVLVWSKTANEVQMAGMTRTGLETIHDHLITSALQFTHWMPLPAAPKGEK